jgi:hypothetical protein
MKIVVFYNNKGGVGKTTLAAHLARRAEQLKIPTVAVAVDPQADLMRYLIQGDANIRPELIHKVSDHLVVFYSPKKVPAGLTRDLVIVDMAPAMELAPSIKPNLWVVPVDSRAAADDLMNVIARMEGPEGDPEILIVLNRADAGGQRTLHLLQNGVAKIPGTSVCPYEIPDSAGVKRQGDYYKLVWDDSWARLLEGAIAMQKVCDFILAELGLLKGRKS